MRKQQLEGSKTSHELWKTLYIFLCVLKQNALHNEEDNTTNRENSNEFFIPESSNS